MNAWSQFKNIYISKQECLLSKGLAASDFEKLFFHTNFSRFQVKKLLKTLGVQDCIFIKTVTVCD